MGPLIQQVKAILSAGLKIIIMQFAYINILTYNTASSILLVLTAVIYYGLWVWQIFKIELNTANYIFK